MNFKMRLRMQAGRTFFWRLFAFVYESAVAALPIYFAVFLEHGVFLNVFQESQINFVDVFGNTNPIVVEIGFGMQGIVGFGLTFGL